MRSKLQHKLFVIVATIALVPLVLLSLMGYISTRRTLLRATTQNLRALARLQALQFDEYIREKQQLLRTLSAKETRLSSLLAKHKGKPTQSLRTLLRHRQTSGKLTGLGIIDHSGQIIASTGTTHAKPPRTNLPHKPNATTHEVIHFSKASETILRMVAPLQTTTYTLVADFPFSLHQRFLQEKQAPAFRGEIYLLDRQARILCGSLDMHQMHHLFGASKALPFAPKAQHPPRAKVLRYQRKGRTVFGIAVPIREVPWTLLIELPQSRALQDLHQMRTTGGLLILTFSLLLLLAIRQISRRIVSPLHQLLNATHALRQGTFDLSLPPASRDEIGQLTQAFDQMGQQLQSHTHELEEKVAERTKELQEAQRFSDLLFHAIPEVILVTDRDLRVIKANRRAQELFGETLIGSFCYEVFEGEGATCESCVAFEVLTTGEPRSQEDEVPHPQNGELFYKDFYPIHDHKGEIIGVLESAKIITHQKHLLAQIVHQEKIAAVGLLASGVTHEIGNPLASIYALVQSLLAKPNTPHREVYKELEERCLFIQQILETLSDYARKKPERSVPLDPYREIENAIAIVRFDRRLKQVQLETDISPDMPLLWGREGALSQIITNLLINALDAVQHIPNAQICLKAWPDRDGVRIHVTDNGAGIDESLQDKIFEPFFTTKGPHKGTGLGLSVSKELVTQWGGTIQASPHTPQGTCFTLSLPGRQVPSTDPHSHEKEQLP